MNEQNAFTVVLADAGPLKLNVLKEVKDFTGLGLKEAKDLVDNAPRTVVEGVSRAEAERLKARLEAAGATVDLK